MVKACGIITSAVYVKGEKKIPAQTFLSFKLERELLPGQLSEMMLAIRHIYTTCWLLSEQRNTDAVEYIKTNDPKFEEETGFVIKVRVEAPETKEQLYKKPLLELQAPPHTPLQVKETVKTLLGVAFVRQRPNRQP